MKNVGFTCNESALPTVTGILKQLAEVSSNRQKRIIRIGGDEKIFSADDIVFDITIDGALDTTPYIPSIRKSRRKNQSSNPPSLVSSASSQPVPSVTSVVASDSQTQISDENKETVVDVVKEFVDSRRKFTAFDITKEVKSRGVRERHGSIKKIVHEMFENDDMLSYIRELIQIDNVSTAPFLYLPNGDDPEDYFSENQISGQLVTA